MPLIGVEKSLCVGCNACIRACPAPEANKTVLDDETGQSFTSINHERCIGCGECIRTCRHGARYFEDDLARFMRDVKNEKIDIIAAPSIKTAFPKKWRKILDWFRGEGAAAVYDGSLGADICTWAHLKYIEDHPDKKIITQPCAAIVNYIKKYRRELLGSLSPIHSPLACEAVYLKEYVKVEHKLSCLTPCIAKKDEFDETGLVDYNITFSKLSEYFEKKKIQLSEDAQFTFQYNFNDMQGTLGGIYPRPGGLRDNLWFKDPDLNITTSEGVHKAYPELDLYATTPDSMRPDVFDVLSCEYGCTVGPGSAFKTGTFEIMDIMHTVEIESKKLRRDGRTRKSLFADRDRLFEDLDRNLDYSKFVRVYKATGNLPYVPKDADLESAYLSMGKVTEAERNYDCHACGYKSCREMAVAVYRGLNVPSNCMVFARTALQKRYKEVEKLTKSVGDFATKLTADTENIYASLLSIDERNKQGLKYTGVVDNLLNQVISKYDGETELDEEQINELIMVLNKLQSSLAVMNSISSDTATNSAAIREAMEEVANATMELSRMVDELVNKFEGGTESES